MSVKSNHDYQPSFTDVLIRGTSTTPDLLTFACVGLNLKLQIIAVRLELGYSLSDKQKEVWDNANDGDKEKACLTIKNKVYE